MGKEIIFLVFIFSIQLIINDDSNCLGISIKEGTLNCSSYKTKLPGFSCYNIRRDFLFIQPEYCGIFPTEESIQRQYVKLLKGFMLEERSVTSLLNDYLGKDYFRFLNELIFVPEKETYQKGETIKYIKYNLTDSDIKVINSKKNCYNYFYGKLFNLTLNKSEQTFNISSLNILDKNKCFNAEKFEDNENLVDCGYAHFNIVSKNNIFNMTTCFFIPDNISDYLLSYYSNSYKSLLDAFLGNFTKINNGIFKLSDNKNRILDQNIEYEIIVENKNGKKVKYTSDNDMIQYIVNDNENVNNNNNKENKTNNENDNVNNNSDDNGDDYEDDAEKITPSSAFYYNELNIFIVLALLSILLLL